MLILMCPPNHYDVTYKINPWMTQESEVNKPRAIKQWQQLRQQIEKCGAKVITLPPQKNLPDMVFTANAAFISNNTAYLAEFAHPQRQEERKHFKRFFVSRGTSIVGDAKLTNENRQRAAFEGAGDALAAGETLFLGHGFRSNKTTHKDIAKTFPQYKCISLELINSHYYHLDTCFCPLNNNTALYYPAAFSNQSQQKIQKNINAIAVPQEEARKFACNAVVIDKQVIIPSGCPKTKLALEKKGFDVYSCELDEFLKSGGAAKCLTLMI